MFDMFELLVSTYLRRNFVQITFEILTNRMVVELLKMGKIHAIHVIAIQILKIKEIYVEDYQNSLEMDIVMIAIIIQDVILMLGIVALMYKPIIVQNATVLQVCIIRLSECVVSYRHDTT